MNGGSSPQQDLVKQVQRQIAHGPPHHNKTPLSPFNNANNPMRTLGSNEKDFNRTKADFN